MPDKFQGKSAEEIAKSYLELEKLHSKPEEVKEEPTETPSETPEGQVDYNQYYESYLKNDGLTEEDYSSLKEEGLDKEQVDEQLEFIKYKAKKAEAEILDGIDPTDYSKAALKAGEEWGEDKAKAFNKELAEASPYVQKVLVKDLMQKFGTNTSTTTEPLHTSTPQIQSSKGYKDRSELLADIADPRYESDKSFNRAVEAKLALTDDSGW